MNDAQALQVETDKIKPVQPLGTRQMMQ